MKTYLITKIIQWLTFAGRWENLLHLSNYREYWNSTFVTSWEESRIWKDLVLDDREVFYNKTLVREPLLTALSRLIDLDDYIEGQNFTRIHQIMCGLSNVSLDVELKVSNDIDTLDSHGRSALWYAVTHRRHDYVCRLLEAGADPNIGNPPVLRALGYPSDYAITKALLDYGAVFGPFNEVSTSEWWADINGSDILAIDELLVKYGLDPNHRGSGGRTVLVYLSRQDVYKGNPRRLNQLIGLGSNIEIADEVGMTAIMHAVFCSSCDAFGVLARAGARLDLKSAKGSTILHLAVAHEYYWSAAFVPRICESFRDADLTKLDLDAKDNDGHRAFDLLRMRNGPNWEDYCKHIGLRWIPPLNEDELEDELEAISALEDLLHHVQEVQGVPEADRYPPLGEYCSRIVEEEPVPGAWPMYEGAKPKLGAQTASRLRLGD